MAKDTSPSKPKAKAQTREERLKAALKANMGRRKAQARARSAPQGQDGSQNTGKSPANEGE